MPEVYHYDDVTGALLASTQARLDPIDGGPMVPRSATLEAPPSFGDGKIAVRENDQWAILTDRRGEVYWLADGSSHEILAIGEEPPAGAYTTPPPPSQDTLSAHLADLRWVRETGGILVNGFAVETNRESQALMANALQTVTSWPVKFKGRDGAFQDIDEAGLQAIVTVVTAHVQAAFAAESSVLEMITDGSITDMSGLEAAWAATA
ncbi:MAG: DUF4376 domain-containing protein [Pseudomonadota bacterium]